MPTLNPNQVIYDSDQFQSADGRLFTAFASDLSHTSRTGLLFGAVWRGQLESGFNIRSKKTGLVKEFVVAQRRKDKEGDIQWFELMPLDIDVRMVVKVFNT